MIRNSKRIAAQVDKGLYIEGEGLGESGVMNEIGLYIEGGGKEKLAESFEMVNKTLSFFFTISKLLSFFQKFFSSLPKHAIMVITHNCEKNIANLKYALKLF
jgi:hypothetical protein